MRDLLGSLAGCRHRFRARAARLGNDESGQLTLLLCDVTWATGGAWIADHLWIPLSPALDSVRGALGGAIAFSATVRPYRRKDGSRDYTLGGVEDVRVLRTRRGQ